MENKGLLNELSAERYLCFNISYKLKAGNTTDAVILARKGTKLPIQVEKELNFSKEEIPVILYEGNARFEKNNERIYRIVLRRDIYENNDSTTINTRIVLVLRIDETGVFAVTFEWRHPFQVIERNIGKKHVVVTKSNVIRQDELLFTSADDCLEAIKIMVKRFKKELKKKIDPTERQEIEDCLSKADTVLNNIDDLYYLNRMYIELKEKEIMFDSL